MFDLHVCFAVDDTIVLISAALLLPNMVQKILDVVALIIFMREFNFNIEPVLFIDFKVFILFP